MVKRRSAKRHGAVLLKPVYSTEYRDTTSLPRSGAFRVAEFFPDAQPEGLGLRFAQPLQRGERQTDAHEASQNASATRFRNVDCIGYPEGRVARVRKRIPKWGQTTPGAESTVAGCAEGSQFLARKCEASGVLT
jgi:hypothetical protein